VIAFIQPLLQRLAAQLPILLLLLGVSGGVQAVTVRAVSIEVSSAVTTLGATPLVKDGDQVTVRWDNSASGDGP
jgi:hypothetical protein